MDAFFASVELAVHPEWRGRPVIVGAGPGERGVVSTCSYEARKFGVRSAMPSRTAWKLCPHAVFVEPHMELYKEVSDRAFETFEKFSPFVEGVSIDEAFLDITGTAHLFGSAAALGEALRAEVRKVCRVTCSVGIAPNRLLAKIGSEENKPDGLSVMPFDPAEIARFLAPKPVTVLWGVGRKTAETLKRFGMTTCGALQQCDGAVLERILGRAAAAALKEHAFGRADDRVYFEPGDEKSVSREHTFAVDETAREAVREKLLALVEDVGMRFRRKERRAKTAKLKLRDASFSTISRQMRFPVPSRDDIAFRKAALALFDAAWPPEETRRTGDRAARLVGFGVADIAGPGDEPAVGDLFGDMPDADREKREKLSAALDALREKGLLG